MPCLLSWNEREIHIIDIVSEVWQPAINGLACLISPRIYAAKKGKEYSVINFFFLLFNKLVYLSLRHHFNFTSIETKGTSYLRHSIRNNRIALQNCNRRTELHFAVGTISHGRCFPCIREGSDETVHKVI